MIFIERPYYSVIKANKIKGVKSVDKHNSKDKIVCDLVDYFKEKNQAIKSDKCNYS